jgi:Ca2+-binding RTX toxin-like protein
MHIRMAAVVAASFVFPAAAQASSQVYSDGTNTIFQSGGEPADVRIFTAFGPPFGMNIQVTDLRGGMTVGAGCTAGTPVLCPGSDLAIALNGGDDRVVSTGDSDQSVSGGTGNDLLRVSSQLSTVTGGSGNDTVEVNSNLSSDVHGNGGNDVIWGFENFPTLSGDGGNDFIYGSGGTNHLIGAAGDDQLIGATGRLRGGTIEAGAGADVVAFLGTSSGDPWDITAGDGPDVVVGSRGADTVAGGGGADVIDVTGDGQSDAVTCGPGIDRIYLDPEDTAARDCELRYSSAMPASSAVTAALDRAANIATELQPLFDDPRT